MSRMISSNAWRRALLAALCGVALLTYAACGEPASPGLASDMHSAQDMVALDMSAPQDMSDMADMTTPQDMADPGPRRCNGHEALCARTLPEVVLAASHNGMSNRREGWAAPNHNLPLRDQLDHGVRGFLLDVHAWRGELYFCHSSCSLGRLKLVDGLRVFRDFLTEHPNEVLVFILEDYITGEEAARVFQESGLIDHVFTPEYDADGRIVWPTLDEMIEESQQLVVTTQNTRGPAPWYLLFNDIGFDTPYSYESADEFTCARYRGTGDDLFLVNHWLGPLPTEQFAAEVNAYDVLFQRAQDCQTEHQHVPNLLAVDFQSIGDLIEVVDVLNGVETPR